MRTSNPALKEAFSAVMPISTEKGMTIQGTVNKSLFLVVLAFIAAMGTWVSPAAAKVLIWPALIIGIIVALVTVFKKEWAPICAPIYAVVEGVVLGAVSVVFEAMYPGIVFQAVLLTFGTLFCMLAAYKTGLIRATEKFKLGVIAATGAVAMVYIIMMIASFFGANIAVLYSSSPAGIIFSVVIVIIAALNLVLDFDFIEKGAGMGAPKYMEWYAGFSLLVTLVWLYLEVLRLLAKSKNR
ncbi:MAG: Bax inhibitor-1/YccA family protein [Candidatus Omnitrophica bacterium]|nr:Bax inhibitor-1/YccA family protein [Candidatus Omnitrophota bacterium]